MSLVPYPRKRDAQVLQIQKPEAIWSAAAARSFPLGEKGRLRLRFSYLPGAKGILIALIDHSSTPFDQEDHLYSLYNFSIDEKGKFGERTHL